MQRDGEGQSEYTVRDRDLTVLTDAVGFGMGELLAVGESLSADGKEVRLSVSKLAPGGEVRAKVVFPDPAGLEARIASDGRGAYIVAYSSLDPSNKAPILRVRRLDASLSLTGSVNVPRIIPYTPVPWLGRNDGELLIARPDGFHALKLLWLTRDGQVQQTKDLPAPNVPNLLQALDVNSYLAAQPGGFAVIETVTAVVRDPERDKISGRGIIRVVKFGELAKRPDL